MTEARKSIKVDALDTMRLEGWLWTWMVISSLSTGIVIGNVLGDSGFHWGGFFGGLLGGAIANIPVMVGFYLVLRVIQNQLVNKAILWAWYEDSRKV
jgi:hypothetical protein